MPSDEAYWSADAPGALMIGSHSAKSSRTSFWAWAGDSGGSISMPWASIFSRTAGNWPMRFSWRTGR